MIFNEHLDLEGKHALLGASNYHWINYDQDALYRRYRSSWSTTIGTSLHNLCKDLIDERIKLNKNDKHLVLHHMLHDGIPRDLIDLDRLYPNLVQYVNDAIGFRMKPECVLYYSPFCFGTADAIMYRDSVLRVHDLKTGETPAHIEQLEIYAALFCLEYGIKPIDISTELRIYQNGEVLYHNPTAEEITPIMSKIVAFDKELRKLKEE